MRSSLGGCNPLLRPSPARRDTRDKELPTGNLARRDSTTTAPVTAKNLKFRQRQDGEAATAPARPRTEPSEQPRESATRTGCRAGDQQHEHRHYDADSKLTQRAANPARADNGARRDQQQKQK